MSSWPDKCSPLPYPTQVIKRCLGVPGGVIRAAQRTSGIPGPLDGDFSHYQDSEVPTAWTLWVYL